MSYKMNKPYTILVAASLIALILVTTTGFNHYYTAFAVTTKTGTSKSSTGGSSGAFLGGASPITNSNILTKKQLSSFTSCINTANKSAEGLTHKVVTNCLDTVKGVTPATTAASSSTTTGGSSSSASSPSLAPSATSKP
jgi:hypothetical protein